MRWVLPLVALLLSLALPMGVAGPAAEDRQGVAAPERPAETLRLVAPADPLQYILAERRETDLFLRLESRLDRPQRVRARWRLVPFLEPEAAASGEESLALDPAASATLPLRLRFPERGYYELRLALESDAGGRTSLLLSFAVLDPLAAGAPDPASPFGINARTLHPQALEMIRLSGASWVRTPLRWALVEPEAGRFETEEWDRLAAAAAQARLHLVPVVRDIPGWASRPAGGPDPGAYARLLDHLGRRYGESLRVWDLWDKPDHTWDDTPVEFGQYLARLADALRTACPGARVLFGGCSEMDLASGFRAFTEGLFDGLGKTRLDLFAIQPYCAPRSPEEADLRRRLANAVRFVEKRGGQRPVWITEIGWPTADDESSVPEALQAAYLVRACVLALSVPEVERIFWHELLSGENRRDPEAQFGLLRAGLRPKPAYVATAHLTRTLAGARFLRALALGSIAQGYAFRRPGGETVAVLWSTAENLALDVRLPRETEVTQIDGRPLAIGARQAVPLTALPLYLRFRRGSEEQHLQSLERARLTGGEPLALEAHLDAEGLLVIRATNRTRGPLRCQVGARAEGPWGPPQQEGTSSTVAAGGTLIERLDAGLPADPTPARSAALLVGRAGDDLATATVPLRLLTASRVRYPPHIDGNPQEWEGFPGLVLASPESVAPGRGRGAWSGPEDLSARLMWAWDATALYLCARVTDDRHVPALRTRALWRGDSIQVAFDPRCDTLAPGYDENDSEVGIALRDGVTALFRWAAPPGRSIGEVPAIAAAARREGAQTCYEAAFPWGEIAGQGKEGRLLGVGVLVNDDDGAGRKCWLETSPGLGDYKNARAFWRLRLGGE